MGGGMNGCKECVEPATLLDELVAKGWFGLDSLFNSISTSVGYLMPKPSLQKNNSNAI